MLVQEPHILDAEDEDFDALSTVHVISAEEEGHELRSSTRDVSDASESDVRSSEFFVLLPPILDGKFLTAASGVKRQAFRWLAGVPGFSKELMLIGG